VGPGWLVDTLAAVMLVTAAYCFGRLVAAEVWHRTTHFDVDVGHVAMGVAMAGMLVESFRTLPAGVWEVIFGCLSGWFGVQIVRFVSRWGIRGWDDDHLHHASHYVTHLAMALAMLYMFLDPAMSRMSVGSTSMTMTGSSASSATASGLPLVLAFVLLVAAVWYADSLTRFVREGAVAGGSGHGTESSPAAGARSAVGPVTPEVSISPMPNGELTAGVVVRRHLELVSGQVLSCQDRRWLAPRLEIATHIAMCVTMSYMLVLLR
jgi:hypothetical protein